MLIRDVSKIAQSQSWEPIKSAEFRIKGFVFYFDVRFKLSNGEMWMGAYLFSRSNHEKYPIHHNMLFYLKYFLFKTIDQTILEL